MKVKIRKIHPAWNNPNEDSFHVGDIVNLKNKIITATNGIQVRADDLCKCFSNNCSYSDIFEKIE